MRAVFIDANPTLAAVVERLQALSDVRIVVNRQPEIQPQEIPTVLEGAEIAIVDHTSLPTETVRDCKNLGHVIFLGTGARSYMNVEELAALGVEVHTIKGYGDTAVAEMTVALMWAAAKCLAFMDRGMRDGQWLRTDGMQLSGKTLGLIGFGGIAAEVARLAVGMEIVAWNRTPREHPRVRFVALEELLASSDVVSLHLSLNDETTGFLSARRISLIKPGAILINTARGALVDEQAMIAALRRGHLRHAALDVYNREPLPADHPLMSLPNVTLSAHSAFRTPEASDELIKAALQHCRRITSRR